MLNSANRDLKQILYWKRVTYAQLAAALGFSEGTLYRRMRIELPEEVKQEYLEKVEEIVKERQA